MKTRRLIHHFTLALIVVILPQTGCSCRRSPEVFCFDDPSAVLHRAEYFIQSGKVTIEGGVSFDGNDLAKLKAKIAAGALQLIEIHYSLGSKTVTVNFLINDTLQPKEKIDVQLSKQPDDSAPVSYTYLFLSVRIKQDGEYAYSSIGEVSRDYLRN